MPNGGLVGLFPVRLPEEDDARKHIGVLEDRGVTEIHDLLEYTLLCEK
jgi:hypothetical protein